MKQITTAASMLFAAFILAAGAGAQAPQGGQGFAGQGLMRGGGMMNTVNPTQSHAMELLQRQEVRSDLHLDVKQKAALDELMNSSQTDLQERMRKQFQSPELQAIRKLPQDEQRAKMQ